MKNVLKFLFAGLFLVFVTSAEAQIKTPAASPGAKLESTVGLTTVSLDYSRPSKKGRKIFGDLVPFDALWRTGANMNSIITFSDDVMIGGADVKKGAYAVFTKPGKATWEVYFYKDTNNGGTPATWDDAKVAAKTTVTPKIGGNVETFTMNIANVTNESFELEIMWDNTTVAVGISVPTDKKVSASITQVMAGASMGDYYSAAVYYRDAKKDLNQALTWINKSVEMGNDKFWVLRQKSLIEADLGNFKAAIATANQSLEKAQEAKNNDYIKMNNESIAAWSKK